MAQDLIAKVSLASSFGIHSIRKSEDVRKYRNGKFAAWAGFVIFLSVGCLMSMIFIAIAANAGKPPKTTKTKRFVEFNENDYIKNTKAQQVSQIEMTSNVRVVPENQSPENWGPRRMGKHPNHRYAEMESEDKIYKKMMKDLYVESGWSPKPLGGRGAGGGGGKGTRGERVAKGKPKALGSPMRLKGFYIQPHGEGMTVEDQDNEFSDNYYYLREINELMRNDSREREKEENWLTEKDLKSHGLPFRLPAKEFEPLKRYQTSYSKRKNYWAKPGSRKRKRKPLTILLEIYPMSETSAARRPPNPSHPGFEPMMTSASNLQADTFAKSKPKNKMLMKLTLYPKKRKEENIGNFHPRDDDDEKKPERRTFSLFSKKKKKKYGVKECLVIGLYPYGKPVTAKWKDEDGEWIYAKHVTVKHLEDDYHWD